MRDQVNNIQSIVIGLVILPLSLYCLQYAILPNPWVAIEMYYASFFALAVYVAMNSHGGIIFRNILVRRNQQTVAMLLFMATLSVILFLYFFQETSEAFPKKFPPSIHLTVGILLLFYSLSALLGSFFAGFGMYLLAKNPILWVSYYRTSPKDENQKDA